MPRILEEVSRVSYLSQVVVTLGRADAQQFERPGVAWRESTRMSA